MTTLRIRNVRAESERDDGHRVLVDRLWPRGLSKQQARFDDWCKEVAPSEKLRTWFGHDEARFAEFRRRYRAELDDNEALGELRRILRAHDSVTLLYAAKDDTNNNAVVLLEYLRERRSGY